MTTHGPIAHSHIPSLDERSPEADHLTGTKIRPATNSLIHEAAAHRTPPPDNMKALLTIRAGRTDIGPEHT